MSIKNIRDFVSDSILKIFVFPSFKSKFRLHLQAYLASAFFLTIVCCNITYAQILTLNTGVGSAQIKANSDHFLSSSDTTRRQIGLTLEFRKEDAPISFSLRGTLYSTNKAVEKWQIKDTEYVFQENSSETSGLSLEALGNYTFYNYSTPKGSIILKPFMGGSFLYKRFELKRTDIIGSMITILNNSDNKFFLGTEDILAIGVMPSLGIELDIPKYKLGFSLDMGRGFLATSSSIDYEIVTGFTDGKRVYPIETKGSGYSMSCKLQFTKRWESFLLAIGYEWERMDFDDKSVFLFQDFLNNTKRVYIPFPELEIRNDIGFLNIAYFF